LIPSSSIKSSAWDEYAKEMLQSFIKYWPKEIPLFIFLDDNALEQEVANLINSQHAYVAISGIGEEQAKFIEQYKGKDDPKNYRRQLVKFSYKIFALNQALDLIEDEGIKKTIFQDGELDYLIWLDADVITKKVVTVDAVSQWCPGPLVTASYLGRKDWNHSECGWVAYGVKAGAKEFLSEFKDLYISGKALEYEEWHDSFLFDELMHDNKSNLSFFKNLTEDMPGVNIWDRSPMAPSIHNESPFEEPISR